MSLRRNRKKHLEVSSPVAAKAEQPANSAPQAVPPSPPEQEPAPADAAVSTASFQAGKINTPSAPQAGVPEGYMRDARGRLVPLALVKPEQMLEDALVRGIHEKAEKLSAALLEFRESAFEDVEALLAILADKYSVNLGGDRGNITLDTFDGELIVQVSIGDQIDLGPELQVAKTLIDRCIHSWSQGADVKLQALVNDAFDVDKKGNINVGRVLALRRMNIDDGDWKKAMDAIGNATRVVRSKRYLRLYRKDGANAKQQVPLDLASV
jgi:hypothetical protein